jgi:hypothetical protein
MYQSCEKQIKNLQEEKEILKIENKDMQELLNLKENEKMEVDKTADDIQEISINNEKQTVECNVCEYPIKGKDKVKKHIQKHRQILNIEEEQKCSLCKETIKGQEELKRHILKEHEQHNCKFCSFQATTRIILIKHLNMEHCRKNEQLDGTHKCQECQEQFSTRWNLMNHNRDEHQVKEVCSFFLRGPDQCKFSEERCWFSHKKPANMKNSEKEEIKCYTCHMRFATKAGLMQHRKKSHKEEVKKCNMNENGQCRMGEACWYIHQEPITEHKLDFQKRPENLAPPDKRIN